MPEATQLGIGHVGVCTRGVWLQSACFLIPSSPSLQATGGGLLRGLPAPALGICGSHSLAWMLCGPADVLCFREWKEQGLAQSFGMQVGFMPQTWK